MTVIMVFDVVDLDFYVKYVPIYDTYSVGRDSVYEEEERGGRTSLLRSIHT